jgi:Protein of unknown function (DUF2505)
MHTTIDLRFTVPTDDVVHLVNNDAFVHYKAERAGSRVLHVDITPGADGSYMSAIRRVIATDQIPTQVSSFVGNELELRQIEAWAEPTEGINGRRFGTAAVEITGAPVRMTGSIVLEPAEGGSVMTYTGEIKSPIPLFGASVEQAADSAIRQALITEASYAEEWLAEHPLR